MVIGGSFRQRRCITTLSLSPIEICHDSGGENLEFTHDGALGVTRRIMKIEPWVAVFPVFNQDSTHRGKG